MNKRNLKLILIMILTVALLWGCGAAPMASDKSDGYNDAYREEAPAATNPVVDLDKTGNVLPEGRKLIRRVNIEAQTQNMDALLPEIEGQVATLGGYIENREVYSNSSNTTHWRTARMTIRIPSDKADQFLNTVDTKANVVSLNENLTDVTLDYVATESRIKALRAEEARLLELMDAAKNLSELLEVEKRLTDVAAQLEAVESQLRLYDNQIDYTSITLNIRQVTELSKPEDEMSVWERIATGFTENLTGLGDTLVDFFVWVIASSPVLVFLGAVGFGLVKVITAIRRRKRKKQADKNTQQ